MIRIPFLLILVSLAFSLAGAQVHTISGTVRDASTGEVLSAGVVRVVGTPLGTIANPQGAYRLSLGEGTQTLAFSYIGYQTETVRFDLRRDTVWNVALIPRAIPMAEVIITGEDPAVGIMRKVIQNKKRWLEGLRSYQFEAFTRQTIRRDTAIAQITESYTTGFWQRGDTLREVIRQRRQTKNVPEAMNFASVGAIVNFYDDEIRFAGFRFTGPTAPDAFEEYEFTLQGTRLRDSREVYIIRMNPRSRTMPLFRGTLRVIEGDFALVGVEVEPNEAFLLPFVTGIELRYAQQFHLYDSTYWLPVDIRIAGRFRVNVPGLSIPPIGIESSSSLYDYRVNTTIPDSVLRQPRRLVLQEADKRDTVFWSTHEVLPLTGEEQNAYANLDSTQTLEVQLRPSGLLMALDAPGGSLLNYLDVRFDRVEGFFLGLSTPSDMFSKRWAPDVRAGYGIADRRWKWRLGLTLFLDTLSRTSVSGRVFDEITKDSDADPHLTIINGLDILASKNDHWDYYYRKGWAFGGEIRPLRDTRISLEYARAMESSASKNTDWSIFYQHRRYRENPPAEEGLVSGVTMRVRSGQEIPFGLIRQDHFEVDVERAGGRLLGGDLDFLRAEVAGELHLQTLLRRTLFPARLSVRIEASGGWGSFPKHRLFALVTDRTRSLDPLGRFRAAGSREFLGDRSFSIFLEHNFRSYPFLILDIPPLYQRAIEVIVFVNVGRTWLERPSLRALTPDPQVWYTEAGLGIGRILTFFRVDVTRRFTGPRAWAVDLSISPLL